MKIRPNALVIKEAESTKKHDDDKRNKTRRGLTGDYKSALESLQKNLDFSRASENTYVDVLVARRSAVSGSMSHSTEIVFEEAGKLVPVNENGRQSLISIGRLAVRQAAISAARGTAAL